MDNSNRTSHCNVGHSIGSSGKTYEKTPRQRNPQKGLVQGSNDDKRNHYSHLLCNGGVVSFAELIIWQSK